jgi:hypothetical protein
MSCGCRSLGGEHKLSTKVNIVNLGCLRNHVFPACIFITQLSIISKNVILRSD